MAVPRKTISQKRVPAKPGNGLIFKGLLPLGYGRISGEFKKFRLPCSIKSVHNKILGVQTEISCGPFGERALQRYL
jgi:hypothetical protein